MAEHKFQDIWKEQCAAARDFRVQSGSLSSLDYLIGKKLMTYADTAVTRPVFARELPRFVAEMREIFNREGDHALPRSSRARGGDRERVR